MIFKDQVGALIGRRVRFDMAGDPRGIMTDYGQLLGLSTDPKHGPDRALVLFDGETGPSYPLLVNLTVES